ncbi:MAG TPA: hypothetical protein VGI22_05045 [Xanthobacteraceae bacterium]|jgi:hypothetical protein
MLTKFAFAAALIIGSATAVLANDIDRNDTGGFHVGPLGQEMGGEAVNPTYHRSLRAGSQAHASASCESHAKFYTGLDGVRHHCP